MNDLEEIDIYENLGYVDLNRECEKLQAEISKLQEENGKFLRKIDTLVKEKEVLVQKNKILQKNISILLKTAKEEIQRKDAKILELRVELTKVQAKKFIKEKPVIEDKFKDLINTGPKLDSDENKFSDKPKKQYDGPDNRYRLSEKIDDRFDNRRTRRDDDRHRKYSRRRSRSPKKSKSKSPYRTRVKSPNDRKRKRSPAGGTKRRRSRSRSPKKIAKSPIRSEPVLEASTVTLKPVECPNTTVIPMAKFEDADLTNTPEEPKTDSTDQNKTDPIQTSTCESPVFSQVSQSVESIEPEDGEICDDSQTVNTWQPKTLYAARMENRLKQEEAERKKEIIDPPKSEISAEDASKTDQPSMEPPAVDPPAIEHPIIEPIPTQSIVETFSPFKNNYKLVPWSPAPKKPDSVIQEPVKTIEVLKIDKPAKPLELLDIATEPKKTEPQPGFDIKSYRIPKKKTSTKPPKKTEKDVKKRVTRPRRVSNEKAKTNGKPEVAQQPESDIANFEFFKTMNNKNTSSSSIDLSSEGRRLQNDLHLTDSDDHVDGCGAITEDSSDCSDSSASDLMELIS